MDWYTAVAAVMCICVNEDILAAFHVWIRAVVNLIFTAQLIFRVVGLLTTEPFTWIALVVFVVKGFSTASEKKEEKTAILLLWTSKRTVGHSVDS